MVSFQIIGFHNPYFPTAKHRPALRQAGNRLIKLAVPGSPDIQLLIRLYISCCHTSHIVFCFSPEKGWA